MQRVEFQDLGRIDYKKAWDYQHRLLKEVVNLKLAHRGQSDRPSKHYLLFCEHPPVYTLGRSGSQSNLLLDQKALDQRAIDFYKINRGGDITYHGPGQVVGYPILDLDLFFTDVHKYVRLIEEVIIRTLASYQVKAIRIPGFTGVWLPADGYRPNRKICAIGIHLSRWVTMHGFAFNVNTDLNYFNHIIACGISASDKEVTSLQQELGTLIDTTELKSRLKGQFSRLFNCELVDNFQALEEIS